MDGRIAIVDDELTVCRRLTHSLSKEGYEAEAYQYVTKPLKLEVVRLHANRALEKVALNQEVEALKEFWEGSAVPSTAS